MDRKSEIINAAVEIINTEGFVNFSVGKVSNKLGISKGVFSYHFPTKDLLLKAIVDNYFEQAAKFMSQHIRIQNSACDALDSYIEACLYYAASDKERTVCVVDIMLNCRTENGEHLFQDDGSATQVLLEIFQYGQKEDGFFREFSPTIMAKSVRSIIDTMSLWIANNETVDVEYTIGEVKKIVRLATQKSGNEL